MKGILFVVAVLLLGGGTVLFLTRANTTAEKRPSGLDRSQNGSIQKQPGDSTPREIAWLTDYDKALQRAKKEGTFVVIDFFATWCGPCKMMERTTFTDERVRRRMTQFVPLKIDVDRQRGIAAKYGIQGLPTTAVVGSDGKLIASAVGYLDADDFLQVLSRAKPNGQAQPERGVLGKKAPSLGVRTWFNLPKGKDSVDIGDYEGKIVYLYGFNPGVQDAGSTVSRPSRS